MSQDKYYLGNVNGLAGYEEAKVAGPGENRIVEVVFADGRRGLLDLAYPPAVVWAKRAERLRKLNRPVYAEIDPDTGMITGLSAPEAARAMKFKPSGDVVFVAFHEFPARCYIRCSHPRYEQMYAALRQSRDSGSHVLVTTSGPDYEIIDVRSVPESYDLNEPPAPPEPPAPDPPVSWDRAVELFNLMNAESCTPCHALGTGCISFKHPNNGCQIRAHLMCFMMRDLAETPEKIWLDGWLDVPTANSPMCAVSWGWHVAPTLMVLQPGAPDVKMVVDPSIFTQPVTVDDWKAAQGDPFAVLHSSTWEQYNPPGDWDDYDPAAPTSTATRETANGHMDIYREQLDEDCALYGPPPYACPIEPRVFFIVDRSTFSQDEVEAMLHQSSPAVIEAAFFIVAEGFVPSNLGIVAADLTGVPSVTPALTFPAVSHMTIEADGLGLEDPAHLLRRQRMTWRYKITFTGSDGFVSERQEVPLEARVSPETGSAVILLIRQPNPYEIDGPTCWLSADLRVFQLREGQSRFNEALGTNASAYIQNVLTRLNNGTAGPNAFESIASDQEESRLELSRTVDVGGVQRRVFNFGIAKVRYRALVNPAPNVRVFFRLFPASSVSLDFHTDTTYRGGEHDGVLKPLLGIINNEVISIPCFAAPRVDTATQSMLRDQRDDSNVKDIPADASGHERVMYFGCWLDFNQDEPRFPYYPGLNDGPYAPADMRPVRDHIRNEHQCLVAEIAFDPAPIPTGTTPALSDKLAQRNLAIVNSANPGQTASHRIPHTFEIRPTRWNIGPDEPTDELMLDWGNCPEGSTAKLWLPGVNVDEIMSLAQKTRRMHGLIRVDPHTLAMPAGTGGVAYVPIPKGQGSNYVGLLSIDLPETVKKGEIFKVVVRQVTGGRRGLPSTHLPDPDAATVPRRRAILGAFQITIPVKHKEEMAEREARLLSNLRWIARSIPADSRWRPVFDRYTGQTADRVDALGIDASSVIASPNGDWRRLSSLCRFRALMLTVLIAAFFIGLGMAPLHLLAWLCLPLFVLTVWTARVWFKRCSPRLCKRLAVLTAGAGIAVAVLGLLALAGLGAPRLLWSLAIGSATMLGGVIAAWMRRCF